jgi:chemotaxis signal transduction protein
MSEMLLIAELAGTRIALPAADIRSVIEIDALAPVPHAASHIAGLTAVRSQALTVIDGRASLGLAPWQHRPGDCAAVIVRDGHLYALLLDRIDDVRTSRTAPVPVPGGYGAQWHGAALGMVELDDGPALLVDADALISGSVRAVA